MDYNNFKKQYQMFNEWEEDNALSYFASKPSLSDDRVESPSHYTAGKQEAIDVIEDAIKTAPNVTYGFLQGQVLKYMLRLWLKDNPLEDARKAQWYLNRLVAKSKEDQQR